jgi:hypothetical protein
MQGAQVETISPRFCAEPYDQSLREYKEPEGIDYR